MALLGEGSKLARGQVGLPVLEEKPAIHILRLVDFLVVPVYFLDAILDFYQVQTLIPNYEVVEQFVHFLPEHHIRPQTLVEKVFRNSEVGHELS